MLSNVSSHFRIEKGTLLVDPDKSVRSVTKGMAAHAFWTKNYA